MCDGSGHMVLELYREYSAIMMHKMFRTSEFNWPKQEAPSKSNFRVWNQFLGAGLGMQSNGMIRKKLGSWLVDSETSENSWHAYYNHMEKVLYVRKDYDCIKHQQKNSKRLIGEFCQTVSGKVINLPESATPASTIIEIWHNLIRAKFDIHGIENGQRLSTTQAINPGGYPQVNEYTFSSFLDQQQVWEIDLCSYWRMI